ncbi:MAG: metal-dependent hydrolase [Methanomicrobiaceae archaeon]|nr:metal-dependent hydrolase [Methanomicrobiaceae archaeon]
MKGTEHLSLSLGTMLVLLAPWLPENALQIAVLCGGVAIGALLPDTDAKDSKIHHMNGVSRIFGAVMRPLIIPLMRVIYGALGYSFNPAHRKSLHTLFGVGVYSVLLSLLIWVALSLLDRWDPVALLFMGGLVAGGVLHIVEDCCTVAGCSPCAPFRNTKIAGGISTGKRSEQRPVHFIAFLVAGAALALGLRLHYGMHPEAILVYAAPALLLSWGLFFYIAQFGVKS